MNITNHFTLEGVPFADYFNLRIKPYYTCFENFVNKANFERLMANLEILVGGEEMTKEEFACHFAIIYNETGGTFLPLFEFGGPAYLFSQLYLNNGGLKMSYNTLASLGNIPAGDGLEKRGYMLSTAQKTLWNGTQYPSGEPADIQEASLNCDYYKFRGWGFNQLTGRNNFVAHLQPLLPKPIDSYNIQEWTALLGNNTELALQAFHNFTYKSPQGAFAMSEVKQGRFAQYGKVVSGGWDWYVQNKFLPRANAIYKVLCDGMAKGAFQNVPEWAIENQNLSASQIKAIQNRINERLKVFMLPFIEPDGAWGPKTEAAYRQVATQTETVQDFLV